MNFIKTVFWIGLFAGLVYIGFQFATPYYNFYSFKTGVTEISRFEARSTDEIRTFVMAEAKESGIPVTEADVEISGTSGAYVIKAEWVVEVNLKDQYKKQLKFKVQVP